MATEESKQIVAERLQAAAALMHQTDDFMIQLHEGLTAKGYSPEDAAQMLYDWSAQLCGSARPATKH